MMTPVIASSPDPNPKTPRLRCPPGAIDSHIHLFGPKSLFAFAEGSRYVSEDRLPQTQIAMQDTLGIARAVIVSGAAYGSNTRHLEHALERHGDRFLGVALSPADTSTKHLRRLDRLGVRAVRFVSKGHGPNFLPISADTVARIADLGWHVHYYPYRTELAETGQSLLDLPTDIVIDHFGHVPSQAGPGQPAFQALLRMLDTGRVWVKLSGPMRLTEEEPPYPSVVPLARALAAHRPDRLLWASDWPHVNMNGRTMPNDGDLLDLLLEWVPDEAVRRGILSDNPARLFRLSPPA
jgi:2-pyrone-4,6-dicarboxylate lactonase